MVTAMTFSPKLRPNRNPRSLAWILSAATLLTLASCSQVADVSKSGNTADGGELTAVEPETGAIAQRTGPAAAPTTHEVPTAFPDGTPPVNDAAALWASTSPQLIKHATLRITVDDIASSLESLSEILARHQGDLLQLSDYAEQEEAPRQVQISLRVPQAQLEGVLEAVRSLGTVEEQSITAEDVSSQLVDLQARLRNLRKSEEALLKIMERSGTIPDVLAVNQELSRIREDIERQDAQLKSLQNRVAYSTLSLTLATRPSLTPPSNPIGETLGQTWQTASHAMATLSVGILKLLLWLLVFSPYWGTLLGLLLLGRHHWQQRQASEES